MHVFVTGATGLVGRAACAALLAKGHEVTGLSRSPEAAARLPAGVRAATGDPTRPGPWQEALAACDACVHLAGEPISEGRWTEERKRRIASSRIESTALVAGVIRVGGPGVLVQGSAVGYYGSRGDEELDETSAAGEGFLADVARGWEAAAAPARERARVVLLRMGVVLSREGGALPRLARPFQLFAGGPIGEGRFWMPWIHVADAVGLVVLALEDARASGPLDVTAPEPVRNRDLSRALGEALGRPSFLPAPGVAVRALLGEMASAVLASQRVLPRKALSLGYRFRFPDVRAALANLYAR